MNPALQFMAYASRARGGGIALYGTAASLSSLSDVIRTGTGATVDLLAPPRDALEDGPLEELRVIGGDGPVTLSLSGTVIQISGGDVARAMLADSLLNLSTAPPLSGPVPRHVDFEYFPGHNFLHEGSTWMTVIRLGP